MTYFIIVIKEFQYGISILFLYSTEMHQKFGSFCQCTNNWDGQILYKLEESNANKNKIQSKASTLVVAVKPISVEITKILCKLSF